MARFRTSGNNWEGRPWILSPALVVLAQQIEAVHPQKHPADGTVASKVHDQNNPASDHRPSPHSGRGVVRALDAGESHENDAYVISEAIRVSKDPRARYVIHEARMWSNYASKGIPPFTWRTYTGPAPHSDHFHISGDSRYDNETSLWQITSGGGGVPDMGNWAKPGDPVEDREDMHSVHAWQGNEVMTDKDIDYDENDPSQLDERIKMLITKTVNVMMKP